MIVPDINLLVYAYNRDAPHHASANVWWKNLMEGVQPVGLTWVACLGFLRLMTNRKILAKPLEADEALSHIQSWVARPQVQILQPGPRHLQILASFSRHHLLSSALVTDAHLAALAIETQSELHSNDADFERFPGLRWRNPLA